MWTQNAKLAFADYSEKARLSAKRRFDEMAWGDPNSGCWLWSGALDKKGYGIIHVGSRNVDIRRTFMAHRLGWEIYKGPIPSGLVIDHRICRTKSCVNPDHLVVCSRMENAEQPDGVIGKKRATTHCANGHEYTPENTYYTRHCKCCSLKSGRKSRKERNKRRKLQ